MIFLSVKVIIIFYVSIKRYHLIYVVNDLIMILPYILRLVLISGRSHRKVFLATFILLSLELLCGSDIDPVYIKDTDVGMNMAADVLVLNGKL